MNRLTMAASAVSFWRKERVRTGRLCVRSKLKRQLQASVGGRKVSIQRKVQMVSCLKHSTARLRAGQGALERGK